VRIPDRNSKCISYQLNILGVKVWRDRCQLIAKDSSGRWQTIGAPRQLPVLISPHAEPDQSDTISLAARQYHFERPGSDLCEVLAQTKDFDVALTG